MGQKVHPIGFRLGIIKTWDSKWFAEGKTYRELLHEDFKIRDYIKNRLKRAEISKIEIERAESNTVRVVIHTARPGYVIGKKGQEQEALKNALEKMFGRKFIIDVKDIKKPEMDAQIVAERIAFMIERRGNYRRIMKKAVSDAMRVGAQGIKVMVAGRLGGADMKRREWIREGRVPLQTIRADIDYGFAEAFTTYGVIGVKVWIFKGEVIPSGKEEAEVERLI